MRDKFQNTKRYLILSCVLVLCTSSFSKAQTALVIPRTPPKFDLPVSKNQDKQANAKNDKKDNKDLIQSREGAKQIQAAWAEADAREGSKSYRKCENCIYQVTTREFMTTTIILPSYVKIDAIDLGDTSSFEADIRDKNKIALSSSIKGVDTNLNVYATSGEVFSFYVKSLGLSDKQIPDLIVMVKGGRESILDGFIKAVDEKKINVAPLGDLKAQPSEEDIVKNVPFNPDKLHGWNQYKVYGDGSLKPYMVFRDEYFTYIQFTDDDFAKLDLPTAYIVVDGYDELVNTRVIGNTYIIESTNKQISLKNGDKYLCLKYVGED